MILKNCDIQLSNFLRDKVNSIIGENYCEKRFHSQEYDRDYHVFLLSSDSKALVLKKTDSIHEVNAYKMLMANKDTHTPSIYFIEKENDFYWIAQAYLESCQVGWHKEHIEDLVVRLGKIHAFYNQANDAFNAFKKWQNPSKESLITLLDADLNMDHLNIIFKSYDILNKSYKTFIHGDMIPLNMIVTEEGVKIIDWEHSCIGPYILDLGRLLADYNINHPWINPEWEGDLLRAYYKAINDSGLIISYDQMFLEYQCARLNNYFGIVRAFKSHQWQRSAWYDLNLGKMLETIKKVEGLTA